MLRVLHQVEVILRLVDLHHGVVVRLGLPLQVWDLAQRELEFPNVQLIESVHPVQDQQLALNLGVEKQVLDTEKSQVKEDIVYGNKEI